ncbi:glycoside hydrolase family 63 protein [Polychaeton citri CBS 116435]|uniref:Mannosyl-oligosaccharide glucosidase n=1 Tax=Polychaeton citri CBS 116435 TaxID=1314669 RepID=A0A9P4Q4P3_9PEZI|nr:glycoside hydrolase family 63 protein [Polychaeton citri CBS 116435]
MYVKQLALTWLLALSEAAATTENEDVFSKSSNSSLLWGPYKPNLYFGVRPRLPKAIFTGLMWSRVEDFTHVQHNVRHTCEQHSGMDGYGWDVYDPRSGGIQTVHDKGNGINLETSFVKFGDGETWAARIKGTPRKDALPGAGSKVGKHELKTSVWLTVSLEGDGSVDIDGAEEAEDKGFEGDLVLGGETEELGAFKIHVLDNKNNKKPEHKHPSYDGKPLDRTFVHSFQLPLEAVWQTKALLFSSLKATVDSYVEEFTEQQMPPPWQTYTIPNNPSPGNIHLIQKVFDGTFEFDIVYAPSASPNIPSHEDITSQIEAVRKNFDEKYLETHKPRSPFSTTKYLEFSKSLFSNLIGGIGYFSGDQVIDSSYAPEYDEEAEGFWEETAEARARNNQKLEGPYELFTSVPSRPFFPRGFLWDEGFHLLPILDWDMELVMQILSSWFKNMDEDGWIAREMILGSEARSKVPKEFQTQYPHYANPPTLFLVIETLLDKSSDPSIGSQEHLQAVADHEIIKAWLNQLYPLLQRNFNWYRKTQRGDIATYDRTAFSSREAYRWRGRSVQHILTSGLDDYPRAQPPHPGELHTDLISWMGMMSRSMAKIASYVGETDDEASYSKIFEAIRRNVDDLHWNDKEKTYCDATVDLDYEESVHFCQKGYISIFPFMTGLLGPNSEHLGDILDLIGDESEIWSNHGIRSLSKKSEFYGTDENYWRSPIWMNINYLIVKNLLDIAQTPGPQQAKAKRLYTDLRLNLVETVYESWKETGFAWEQYNPDTGAGQRTQHFTGWTSLAVKIMDMPDLSSKKSGHDEL